MPCAYLLQDCKHILLAFGSLTLLHHRAECHVVGADGGRKPARRRGEVVGTIRRRMLKRSVGEML
jgi:hypothetical protein